jgi:hypothetical protein
MPLNELLISPVSHTKEHTLAAADYLKQAMAKGGPLRDSLNIIRYNGCYLNKQIRSIKIHCRHRLHLDLPATTVPEILLQGNWVHRKGFEPGKPIWVLPFHELLIIIPQGHSLAP